jgi:peroxiredoxin
MTRGSSLVFVLAALLGGACGPSALGGQSVKSAGSVAQESSGGGAPASDFTLRDTDGRQVALSDYLGKKVVVINFWATWCIPCQAELPHLQELYKTHQDQGLVVLGVAMDGPETIAQVPSYVNRYALSFPVLLDEETRVVAAYNPKRTAPLTIEIDRKGTIARVRSGYSAGDEKLIAADVQSLLGH